jgi:predicted DsbA family dithiol-disulfide isomerase
VTIVEFSDGVSAACASGHATLKQLEEAYGEMLRVVTKHAGADAQPRSAAIAVLAAGEQGQAMKMQAALYAHQGSVSDQDLERFARELGLDLDAFNASRADEKWDSILMRNQELVTKLGIKIVPTVFVNGRRMTGTQPMTRWTALIKEEVEKARALVAAGTPQEQVYEKLLEGADGGVANADLQRAAELVPTVVDVITGGAPDALAADQSPPSREAFSDAEWQTLQFSLQRVVALVTFAEGQSKEFVEIRSWLSAMCAASAGQVFLPVRSVRPFQDPLFLSVLRTFVSSSFKGWINKEVVAAYKADSTELMTGFANVASVLAARCTPAQARAFKRELVFVGIHVANARDGISPKERDVLLLLLKLLKWEEEPAAPAEVKPLAG